jgi:hypothetical protein
MSDVAPMAAQALVTAYCGWHIAPSKTETLTLDGPGGQTLLLPSLYVTNLTEVTSEGTVFDINTYDWSEAGIIELRCGCFSCRLRSVTVTLTHGYPNMPADVEAVIARVDDRGTSDSGAIQSVGQVRYATTSSGVGVGMALTDFDRAILDRYKLPPRP